jgi:hypothetical protein
MPKYTEFAPAWIAAAKLSLDPTGAMISKSSRFTPSLLLSIFNSAAKLQIYLQKSDNELLRNDKESIEGSTF